MSLLARRTQSSRRDPRSQGDGSWAEAARGSARNVPGRGEPGAGRRLTTRGLAAIRTLALYAVFLFIAFPASGYAADFQAWLEGVRAEAVSRGITAETLDTALVDLEPIPRVIELDRRQPEVVLTFEQYIERVASDARVRAGRRMLRRHQALLEEIGAAYGVQPRFIVALWGIETNFGTNTGGFPVIAALATLAFDGRRSDFFRAELLNALEILDQKHVELDRMTGSWAGAMGQNQFMPSSFLSFAVDYDGDGRRDIWTTRADIFASSANYLAKQGWHEDQSWGDEVRLADDIDAALVGLEVKKPLSEWRALGLRRSDGGDLAEADVTASLVMPAGEPEPAFLVYDNFRAILQWNRSLFFALTVGQLADRIGGD